MGVGKKEYLIPELGLGTVKLMKAIKRVIDPMGLFNPGKVRVTRIIITRPSTFLLVVS